jgi:hypothetical protein
MGMKATSENNAKPRINQIDSASKSNDMHSNIDYQKRK